MNEDNLFNINTIASRGGMQEIFWDLASQPEDAEEYADHILASLDEEEIN